LQRKNIEQAVKRGPRVAVCDHKRADRGPRAMFHVKHFLKRKNSIIVSQKHGPCARRPRPPPWSAENVAKSMAYGPFSLNWHRGPRHADQGSRAADRVSWSAPDRPSAGAGSATGCRLIGHPPVSRMLDRPAGCRRIGQRMSPDRPADVAGSAGCLSRCWIGQRMSPDRPSAGAGSASGCRLIGHQPVLDRPADVA
jgi:hypothetical protein